MRLEDGFFKTLRSTIDQELLAGINELKAGQVRIESKLDVALALLPDDAARREVEALETKLALSEIQLANLIGLVLKRHVPRDRIAAFIEEANAKAAAEEQEAARVPNGESEALRDLRLARLDALRRRDLDAATDLSFAFAETQRAEQIEAQVTSWTQAAEDAANAFDFRREADAWYRAAETVRTDPARAFGFGLLGKCIEALIRQGERLADGDALREAVTLAEVLHVVAADPEGRGAFLRAKGTALLILGGLESGMARLEEAVVAYRAALEEFTRERMPLVWARTQNSLGNALWTIGKRQEGTTLIKEAVAAHRAALEELTRERVPLDWAVTQNSLGNALQVLGAREGGMAQLEEASAAYRAALEELNRERMPMRWAATQNNLGTVLQRLGARESGTARLEGAIAAYRAALEVWTRERVPLNWAATQNNLGNVLATLGERESGTARLEQAVVAFRAALEEYTRERVPLDWAMT